ncbi:MAG: maleylacetoacetate isomerase [Woeseiaceae bacterium]|nr:maleylacetoacetate isomerase [Woeseiaceae bacterium]MDX2607372.1 maleylacetoacetate isomerase [Woeseiaceae bacterium]
MKLYSYWRSSAAYRVRIALNLKGLDHEIVPVSLLPGEAEHRQDAYRERNPQMLVPFLEDGDFSTGQSMAILEYLEETYPEPALLPADAQQRAAVRSFCNLICCDIHPLNNLRVMQYLKGKLDVSDGQFNAWYAYWIHEGFKAAETAVTEFADAGQFVFGELVSLADTCLIPQVYNARRFKVPLDDYPRLIAVTDACNNLEAFIQAAPEKQPDSTNAA